MINQWIKANCMDKKINLNTVTFGNLKSLRSHALDLVGCMHLFLGLSKSNVAKNNGFKNHYRINI